MVQKSQKRGVHSGNTLRASDCRYNRRYRRQSYLVRNVSKGVTCDTILDDMNINTDDLKYSLNKKARWTIPQILKEHIILNEHLSSDPKLQLTEQHRLNRKNKCIGYFATQGLIRKVIPKRKSYFDVSSLKPKRNTFRTPLQLHETLKPVNNEPQSLDIPLQKKADIVPEISVDIFYPSPSSSSITHNPKYIRPAVDPCVPLLETQNQRNQKKVNRQKHRIRCNRNDLFMYDEPDDDYASDGEIDNDDDELKQYIYSSSTTRRETFTAADVVQYAKKMGIMNHVPKRRYTTYREFEEDKNEKQIYIQTETDLPDPKDKKQDSATTRNNASCNGKQNFPQMEPVKVLLSREETRPEYLKFIYDDKYIECKSFPRSFVIDISQNVRSTAYEFEHLQDQYYKTDFTSCLVFTYDMYTDIYDQDGCDVFSLYLNTSIKQESVRVETLFDFFHGSIDEIIERVCFFFETLEAKSFYTLSKLPVGKGKIGFDALKCSQESSVDAYCMNHGSAYREIFKENQCEKNDISAHGLESVPPAVCYICFESIGEGGQNAVALEACGHWFCQNCWHEHVQSRLNNGSLLITCPEYECKEKVNWSVLVQMINVRQIEQHIKRVHDVSIMKKDNKKWCPNPECGRVIETTEHVKYMNITCKCGTEICFDCLQYAHWPASCEQSTQYWNELKETGCDLELKLNVKKVKVLGKHCPECNQFIEKDGGCFSVFCVCGTSFCWGCRTPWKIHVYGPLCNQSEYGDKHQTKSKEIEHEYAWKSQIESRHLRNAVNNRSARQEHRLAKLKAGEKELMRKLKFFGRKNEARLSAELSEYMTPGKENATLQEKLSSFLKSMVLLYAELHYLGEYTSVYLPQAKGHLRQSLWDVVDRLESLASRIHDKFQDNANVDPCVVINDLIDIRSHSMKTVKGLVKVIDH